jgi:hypothetical protein
MDAVLSHEGIFNENDLDKQRCTVSHHKKQALSVLDQWDLAYNHLHNQLPIPVK